MKKQICSIFLAIWFVFSLCLPVQAAQAEDFAGTRSVVFTTDWSDLENFVNGGRAAFDLVLRSNLPEWLTYDIRTHNRDFYFTLSFDFTSYDDYHQKMAALLGHSPSVLYETDEGLLLIENDACSDILNFLEPRLTEGGYLPERELRDIFRLKHNRITINGNVYDTESNICILPEDALPISVDHLSIFTKTNKDASFTRTITARINTEGRSPRDLFKLEKAFNRAGSADTVKIDTKLYELTVSFNASSQAELGYQTTLCLNSPSFITERQSYVDRNTVSVEHMEFFDLEKLVTEEGNFDFTFTFPSYYQNPASDNSAVVVYDSYIASENQSFITYTFERKLQFSAIKITTDLSSHFGKIQRTILCTIPVDIASEFHKTITDKLRKNLINGSVMNIYDQDGMRHYAITFRSYWLEEIVEFTAAVLNSSQYALEWDRSWIPFDTIQIHDRLDPDDIISNIVPADQITAVYILPEPSWIIPSDNEAGEPITGSTITRSIRAQENIHIAYRQLPFVTVILLAAAVLIVLCMIIARGRRRKQVRIPANKDRFCHYCGSRLGEDEVFCHNCGKKT